MSRNRALTTSGTGSAPSGQSRPGSQAGIQRVCDALILLLAAWNVGCSPLLPKAEARASHFASFEHARAAVKSLQPMSSTVADLKAAGIDPDTQPNIRLLTASDVIQRFAQASPLRREDIDPGIVACMEARDACRGLELTAMQIRKVRTGAFATDFFNFSRTTETTGWRFQALILLVDGVVVHRSWGGQPHINDIETTTNPLGPLQDIGPAVVLGR